MSSSSPRYFGLIWRSDGLEDTNCCKQLCPVINQTRERDIERVINCRNLTMELFICTSVKYTCSLDNVKSESQSQQKPKSQQKTKKKVWTRDRADNDNKFTSEWQLWFFFLCGSWGPEKSYATHRRPSGPSSWRYWVPCCAIIPKWRMCFSRILGCGWCPISKRPHILNPNDIKELYFWKETPGINSIAHISLGNES